MTEETEEKKPELCCPACGNKALLASGIVAHLTPDEEPYESGKVEPPESGEEEFDSYINVGAHLCENCHELIDAWIGDYAHVEWNDYDATEGIKPPPFLLVPPSDPSNNAKRLAHIIMMEGWLDPAHYRLFLKICDQYEGKIEYINLSDAPVIGEQVETAQSFLYAMLTWNLILLKCDVGYYDKEHPARFVRKVTVTINLDVRYPQDFVLGLKK